MSVEPQMIDAGPVFGQVLDQAGGFVEIAIGGLEILGAEALRRAVGAGHARDRDRDRDRPGRDTVCRHAHGACDDGDRRIHQ